VAEQQGVSYATARGWFGAGLMPVPARRAGRMVLVGDGPRDTPSGLTAVSARVSSAGREPDLDRQVARVTARAAARGLPVGEVVTAGSALNGRRRGFPALLRGESVETIVIGRRRMAAWR